MKQTENEQFSAGGVLLHNYKGHRCICLIRRDRFGKSTWCLPKGHLEPGEDFAAAAIREVWEETGIQGEIVEDLGKIRYRFRLSEKGNWCNKQVNFFLMKTEDARLNPKDRTEVVEARWVPIEEALQLADYENERQVIDKASNLTHDQPLS